jgi:hypothetical protein
MNERYYDAFAAAFVRASDPNTLDHADEQVLALGLARGLARHSVRMLTHQLSPPTGKSESSDRARSATR